MFLVVFMVLWSSSNWESINFRISLLYTFIFADFKSHTDRSNKQHISIKITKLLPTTEGSDLLKPKLFRKPDIRGSLNKFPGFFVWALLLIVHIWNSCPLRINLFRLLCICYTVPTTSGRPHWSPLVWACQWPWSQPLSSPQLSHNDSFWA